MTKTKVSTVAIVVLSVLLAAALASTIVLAAFAFSRGATTTITFAQGVQLTVTGVEGSTWKSAIVNSDGTVTSTTAETSRTGLTQGVTLDKITIKNDNTTDGVTIAVRVELTTTGTAPALYASASSPVTKTDSLTFATPEIAKYCAVSGVDTASISGWGVFTLGAGAAATDVIDYIHTVFSTADIADLGGGETFSATIKIAAVPAGADSTANLNSLISGNSFVAFGS